MPWPIMLAQRRRNNLRQHAHSHLCQLRAPRLHVHLVPLLWRHCCCVCPQRFVQEKFRSSHCTRNASPAAPSQMRHFLLHALCQIYQTNQPKSLNTWNDHDRCEIPDPGSVLHHATADLSTTSTIQYEFLAVFFVDDLRDETE